MLCERDATRRREREAILRRRANSDIDCAAQSSRSIYITVPGARERDEVRTASNYLARPDDDSLPQPSRQVWLRERHEEGGNHERQEEQSG